MDYSTAKETIKSNWQFILKNLDIEKAKKKVNSETSYICPFCLHGKNGDGLTFIPQTNLLKCFGCGYTGDIIDFYMKTQNVDFKTAINNLSNLLNIEISEYKIKKSSSTQEDYTDYYLKCIENLKNSCEAQDYLTKRGISLATAQKYMIGYDPNWKSPSALKSGKNPPESKRLIMPTSNIHYVARNIKENLTTLEKSFCKMNEGKTDIFNLNCIYEQDLVFVTEGIFDALSILEVGYSAIALNSTSNTKLFLSYLQEKSTSCTLVICLDNDRAGSQAVRELQTGLDNMGLAYIVKTPYSGSKDANEALVKNRELFIIELEEIKNQSALKPDSIENYLDSFLTSDIDQFKKSFSTGFNALDTLSGGIYSGLYVIAAISSLGKTTFASQLADNIAQSGQDVLFFSMEQSTLEMVSKALARSMAVRNGVYDITSLDIRNGNISDEMKQTISEYRRNVGNKLSIIECRFSGTVDYIYNYVKSYINKTNILPVVIIDYLQILSTEKSKFSSTKENIDNIVIALKRLSLDFQIPVIAISSVNRANYLTPIDFESLKESGCIEFTADVIWGLQLECLNNPVFEKASNIKEKRDLIKKEKSSNPRKIELVCLKNRYGISNFSCYFDYYAKNDLFIERNKSDLTQLKSGRKR